MLFPSISFLFYFLSLFFIVYCATPGIAAKNVILLLASLVFYAWTSAGLSFRPAYFLRGSSAGFT